MVLSWLRGAMRQRRAASSSARGGKRSYALDFDRLEERAVPATVTWSGGGLTKYWSNAQNWQGGVTPQNGDDLVFPIGGLQAATCENDLVSPNIRSITFLAGGYTLNGNPINLSNGVSCNQLTGSNILNLSISLTADQTFNLPVGLTPGAPTTLLTFNINNNLFMNNWQLTVAGPGQMIFNNVIQGNSFSKIVKDGVGRVFIQGSNSPNFDGQIIINNGELGINQNQSLGSTIGTTVINNGASLVLNGGPTVSENIIVNGHGFGGTGAINVFASTATLNGSIIVKSNTTFGVNDTQQVNIIGSVSEDGGSFSLTKVGTGVLRFDNQVLLTGATTINAGTIQLINNGILAASSISILNGGNLLLDNTLVKVSDRIDNNATIKMRASSLRMLGQFLDPDVSERVGTISLEGGHNSIEMNPNTAAANSFLALSAPSLQRTAGSTIQFNQLNLNLGLINATVGNRVLFDTPPSLDPLGGVPTGTGIIPWATVSTLGNSNQAEFATYGSGVTPTTVSGIAGYSQVVNQPLPTFPNSPGYAPSLVPQALANPTAAPITAIPTVTITPTGGNLQNGTYFVRYTYFNGAGETLPSLPSANFTVVPGNIPVVTIPTPLPVGATGYYIYLSNPAATPGSEIRYGGAPFTTVPTVNLTVPQTTGPFLPTVNTSGITFNVPNPTVTPTVDSIGGGAAGGFLAPGTGTGYFARYTFVDATGETLPSVASSFFLPVAGNIPRITLPALPGGATGMNIYLSNPGGSAGSEMKYNTTPITAGFFDFAAAATVGVPVPTVNTSSIAASVVNPTVAPSIVVGGTGGTLPVGTYMVSYTFANVTGETLATTPLVPFTITTAGEVATVTLPVLPAGAASYNLYMTPAGGIAGSERRYNTTPILPNNLSTTAGGLTTFNISAPAPGSPASLVEPPTANTTQGTNPVGPNTNIRYAVAANELITGNVTINSLAAANGGNITISSGATLTVGSGGLLNAAGTLTITGGGVLRFLSPTQAESFIMGAGAIAINVPLVSTNANGLTVAMNPGIALTFGGTTANNYAGMTRLNQGTLNLSKPLNVISVPGDLIVGDGHGVRFATVVAVDSVVVNQFGQLLFVNDPTVAGVVASSGGGVSGGALQPGTYFLKYTFVSGNGGETLASPESVAFGANGNQIPRVTLPPLPVGVTAIKVYLTQAGGASGSETFYGQYAAGANIDLANPTMTSQPAPPALNNAFPNVTVNGGGTLTLQNTAGVHSINNLTMKASNSSGNNQVNGDARINTQLGTLSLAGNVTVLAPDTSSFYFAGQSTITGTGALRLAQSTVPVGGLTRTFAIADGASAYDMILSINVLTPSKDVTLAKTGLGGLWIANASSYNGPTLVSQGSFVVGNNNPLSEVTMLEGTTLAGGIGATSGGAATTIGVVLNANISGTVQPGPLSALNDFETQPNNLNRTTRGILQSQGKATMNTGSRMIIEIAAFGIPGSDFDRFLVGGTLTLNPGTTLVLDLKGLTVPGTAFNVMTWATRVGTFSDVQVINNPKNFLPILKYNAGSLDITLRTATVPTAQNIAVVGPNGGRPGTVQLYNARTRQKLYDINAFAPKAPVEVATGDVNGDGVLDVLTAQNGLVRIFDGTTGLKFTTTIGEFRPFGPGYKGRVFLATGQLDNNPGDDIVASKGQGKALVRAWSSFITLGQPFLPFLEFNPYPGSTTGARVAIGNVDGVGPAEIITASGPKRPFEIQVWNTFQVMTTFFRPYGNGFKKGGFIATGDFNNDGKDDVVVGPGANKPAKKVMVLKGDALGVLLGSFTPFLGYKGAVRVGVADADSNGIPDILAARATVDNQLAFFTLLGTQVQGQAIDAFGSYNGGLSVAGGTAH